MKEIFFGNKSRRELRTKHFKINKGINLKLQCMGWCHLS